MEAELAPNTDFPAGAAVAPNMPPAGAAGAWLLPNGEGEAALEPKADVVVELLEVPKADDVIAPAPNGELKAGVLLVDGVTVLKEKPPLEVLFGGCAPNAVLAVVDAPAGFLGPNENPPAAAVVVAAAAKIPVAVLAAVEGAPNIPVAAAGVVVAVGFRPKAGAAVLVA